MLVNSEFNKPRIARDKETWEFIQQQDGSQSVECAVWSVECKVCGVCGVCKEGSVKGGV